MDRYIAAHAYAWVQPVVIGVADGTVERAIELAFEVAARYVSISSPFGLTDVLQRG
jgi:hypothetical protein